ncbi:MAG: trigger factor [Planctomycetota bacterium]
MDVNVSQDEPNVAKVNFSVSNEEFRAEYQVGIKQMRKRVQLKGFRPGKAPIPMIEKHHGDEITQEVQQHFLRKAYAEAIEQKELKPISHPRVAIEDAGLQDDGSFTLEFEVSLRPEVKLPEYSGLSVDNQREPVSEENIDTALEEVRRQQATPDPVGEEGLEESGMAMATVIFEHDGKTVFEREGLRVSPMQPPPGVEADVFKEAMIGTRDEDVVEVAMTIPDSVEDEDARGKDGICKITLSQALNMVPPSDEDIFKLLEVEDGDALRVTVKERLEEAAQQREQQRVETVLLDQLIDQCDIEIPGPLLEEQTQGRLNALGKQMSEQGLPPEQIETQMEEAKETAGQEAAKGLKALMIVEAIGEKEGLLVTQEDLEGELHLIAQRNQTDVDEVRKYYAENNLSQQMAIELLERKVRAFLRHNAQVQNAEVKE